MEILNSNEFKSVVLYHYSNTNDAHKRIVEPNAVNSDVCLL